MKRSIAGEVARFFAERPPVVVAASGGRDSMVLLHALHDFYGAPFKDRLIVAHLDHAVRPESPSDCDFVRAFCKSRSLRFESQRLDSISDSENLEATLRTYRYRFLESVRRQYDAHYILTAHHSKDVAETFLMRLVGGRELASIEQRSRGGTLLRPFLRICYDDILTYATMNQVPFCHDDTNSDTRFLRNWVREEVLPLLEQRESRAAAIVAEAAILVAEERRFVVDYGDKQAEQIASEYSWGSKRWVEAYREATQKIDNSAYRLRLVQALLLGAPELGWMQPGQRRPGLLLSHRAMMVLDGATVACDLERNFELRRSQGAVRISLKS